MADKRLVDYIKAQLNAGYDISAIEHVLVTSNHDQKSIDAAVNEALMGDAPKASGNKWMIIGGIAVLALIAASYFVWPMIDDVLNPVSPALNDLGPPPVETIEPPPAEEIDEPPAELVPDVLIGPPETEPNYDSPILLPTSAIEVPMFTTVAMVLKLYQTDYVDSLTPSIECDSLGQDQFVAMPYNGPVGFSDVAEITVLIRPQTESSFSQCTVSFATIDHRELQSSFVVTILP